MSGWFNELDECMCRGCNHLAVAHLIMFCSSHLGGQLLLLGDFNSDDISWACPAPLLTAPWGAISCGGASGGAKLVTDKPSVNRTSGPLEVDRIVWFTVIT